MRGGREALLMTFLDMKGYLGISSLKFPRIEAMVPSHSFKTYTPVVGNTLLEYHSLKAQGANAFEVIGRLDHSELRGCNLLLLN